MAGAEKLIQKEINIGKSAQTTTTTTKAENPKL